MVDPKSIEDAREVVRHYRRVVRVMEILALLDKVDSLAELVEIKRALDLRRAAIAPKGVLSSDYGKDTP